MFAFRGNYISYNGLEPTPTSGDPYWYNVGLLQTNESNYCFVDTSTNNFPVTKLGNTAPNLLTPFVSGQGASAFFDGSGDYLTMPANAAFSLGTNNFTFEAWVYVTNFSVNFGGYMPIMGWGGGSYKIFRVRPTAFNFQAPNISADYNAPWPSGVTLVVNTWYHVALVRTSTTSVTAYINGVAGAPVTINASAEFGNATDTLQIGFKSDPGYWWGFISNLRLVKGTAVYTSNFTPSTSPLTAISGTSVLLTFSNQGMPTNDVTVDVSKSAITIGRVNPSNVTYASTSPYVGYPGSLQYSQGGYSTIGYNAQLVPGTSQFTIEFWINHFGSSGIAAGIYGQNGISFATNGWWQVRFMDAIGKIGIIMRNGGALYSIAPSTALVASNTWTHVAIVRDSSNLISIYYNGVSVASATNTQDIGAGTTNTLYFSTDGFENRPMTARYRDFRVVKGTAVYTSNFTPPTTPLSLTSNTTLLLSGNTGAFFDYSSYFNPVTNTSTNAVISTQQAKFSVQSVNFTPSGYLASVSAPQLVYGTGDFTLEGWVYRTTSGAIHSLLAKGTSGTSGWLLQVNASDQLVWYSGSTALRTSTTTIPANTWVYFAICRSGTTGYMFINGTQEGATFTDTRDYNDNTPFLTGADRAGVNGLAGYLDNIRSTFGVARYTSSFSAPTDVFPTSFGGPTPSFVTTGVSLYVDAGQTASYSGSGPTWNDLSGNGWNGTINNATFVSASDASYFSFNGSNAQINFGNVTNANFGTGDFTITFWWNPTTWSTATGPLSKKLTDGDTGWHLYRDGGLPTLLNGRFGSVTNNQLTTAVAVGSWLMYTVVRSGSGSNNLKWYINGISASQYTNTNNITQTVPLYAGWNQQYGGYLNGRMSLIAIYNRALSASEIMQNMTATRGRYGV